MSNSQRSPGGELLAEIARAYHKGDHEGARELCVQASGDAVFDTLAAFLGLPKESSDPSEQTLYLHTSAFTMFCSAGGNAELYDAVSSHLAHRYDALLAEPSRQLQLLEIGVGGGLALIPAMQKLFGRKEESDAEASVEESARDSGLAMRVIWDLIEPVQAQLTDAIEGLAKVGCKASRLRGHCSGLEEFIASHDNDGSERGGDSESKDTVVWDLAQASFAMHNLGGEAREKALEWLREKCGTVVIIEFDQPHFDISSEAEFLQKATYVHERYTEGLGLFRAQLSEKNYDTVMSYFLMPIMLAYFGEQDANRTHEQPIEEWKEQLHAAGFDHVSSELVCPYWWAPCHAITGKRSCNDTS